MSVARTAKPNKSLAELIRESPLRPIRTDRELDRATSIAGRLAVYAEGTLSRTEEDYLDTLTILIDDYERNHEADLPEATPLGVLQHLMEEHEMSISDLGRLIGGQSNASLIMSGKRNISKRVIQVLSKRFKVDPGVFIETSVSKPARGGTMKIEFTDRECYVATTVLHVRSIQLEKGIAAEPTMEDRHWKLDMIDRCRSAMQKIDKAWRNTYDNSRPGESVIKGISKGEWANRKTVVDFSKSELQDVISVLDGKIGDISAKEIRALAKRLEASING